VHLWEVPSLIGKYKAGRYKELPKYIRHFRTNSVRVRADKEIPVNLDGEIRFAKTAQMCLAEEKVHFFYPRGLTW